MALATLTQGHLKLLELCPRRFQYSYLDQLAVPTDPFMLQRQVWGTRFHLVMQQRELGLAVGPLLQQDPDLDTALQGLLAAAPDLFGPIQTASSIATSPSTATVTLRQSEHRRSLAFEGFSLTVVYDLLIMTPDRAQIVDWKTYLTPPSQAQLAQDWQTRLYLYVLTETTDLQPEQLSITYWFVRPPLAVHGSTAPPAPPSQITLPYSTAQHRRVDRDLRRLTHQLRSLVAQGRDFPQVNEAEGHCRRCPFALRCRRTADWYEGGAPEALPAIEDIAEVPL